MTTDELRKTIIEFRQQLSAFYDAVSPELYNLRGGGEPYTNDSHPESRINQTENTPLGRAHRGLANSATGMLSALERLAREI